MYHYLTAFMKFRFKLIRAYSSARQSMAYAAGPISRDAGVISGARRTTGNALVARSIGNTFTFTRHILVSAVTSLAIITGISIFWLLLFMPFFVIGRLSCLFTGAVYFR